MNAQPEKLDSTPEKKIQEKHAVEYGVVLTCTS